MSSRNLPHHLYVWVDASYVRSAGEGFEPAVWFAVRAQPNRAWGCHVMLECGAVYRNVPPQALAFDSLAKAKAELALRQRRYTRPLHIVEQRIVERKIA